jgi:hypothetical protein
MKTVVGVVAIAALCLGACQKVDEESPSSNAMHRGRYMGVGLYPAGTIWEQVIAANPSKVPAAANLKDDDQVIVVVDSDTGELRQCGNLSGYCIGMNPWTKALLASQMAPAPLMKHAADLKREADSADKAKATPAPSNN